MKALSFALALPIAVALVMVGCSDRSLPVSSSSSQTLSASTSNQFGLSKSDMRGPSINGSGINHQGTVARTITLHARTDKDGVTSGLGSLTRISPTATLVVEFQINCLSVTGNVAVVSGILTNSTDPSLIGRHFQYKIVDNGEGANAKPDQVTNMYNVGPDEPFLDCNQDANWDLFDIKEGNYQVREN